MLTAAVWRAVALVDIYSWYKSTVESRIHTRFISHTVFFDRVAKYRRDLTRVCFHSHVPSSTVSQDSPTVDGSTPR